MRAEKSPSAALAVARFRSQVTRLWRSLAARPPALRWSLGLGVLAVLVLLGYLSVPTPAGSVFLHPGRKLSSGDIIKITRALDVQHIAYRADDQGKIEVAADRLEDANAILAKLEVGPRSIEDLRTQASQPDFWTDPYDKLQRQIKGREEILAAMIGKLDGIISAYVSLNRPKGWGGHKSITGPGARPTAFVYLETDGGRELPHKTIQSIQNIVVGSEPDLSADAVTVVDDRGRPYLDAADPTFSTISQTRAREEDLDQEILEQIDWVKGVRVTVQLVAAPVSMQAPPGTPAAPAPQAELPGSSVAVNTPLELEPEPLPGPGPAPTPTPTVSASALPEPSAPKSEAARVWVRVPRSYYYSKAAPDRDPSPDRLQPIVERTESLIRAAVEHVVPPELTPLDVKIDTIPDDLPASGPLRSPVTTDAFRPESWWLPAGVVGGGLIVLLSALGLRLLAGRRPEVRQRRVVATRPGRYRSDPASTPGPGPAERVRELIRLDPEAAAGVLHRWIGQGESLG